jgi:uncharacterized protein (TIGR02147 family)
MDKKITDIFLECKNSTEALQQLYNLFKERDHRFSLQLICSRAEISSRGYLSQVLSGKRTLSVKYRESMPRAFRLDELHTAALQTLIDLDCETDSDKIKALQEKLRTDKLALKVSFAVLSNNFAKNACAFEVFCAFGFFSNNPTFENLVELFGIDRKKSVEEALIMLEQEGYISKKRTSYFLNTQSLIFDRGEEGSTRTVFLKTALEDALHHLPKWINRTSEAHFESGIVSVTKKDYLRILPEIKNLIVKYQVDMESAEADTLVRFNIQIYPATDRK